MPSTSRLRLPLLAMGQAQKELTHNEALLLLDFLVQATCLSGPSNIPPESAVEGGVYLCGPDPTGAWTANPDALACWTTSGWRFAVAAEGRKVVEAQTGVEWRFLSGTWVRGVEHVAEVRIDGETVLRSRQPSIANPNGGTNVDAEARAAIQAVLVALRTHGLIKAS